MVFGLMENDHYRFVGGKATACVYYMFSLLLLIENESKPGQAHRGSGLSLRKV